MSSSRWLIFSICLALAALLLTYVLMGVASAGIFRDAEFSLLVNIAFCISTAFWFLGGFTLGSVIKANSKLHWLTFATCFVFAALSLTMAIMELASMNRSDEFTNKITFASLFSAAFWFLGGCTLGLPKKLSRRKFTGRSRDPVAQKEGR